MMEFYGKIIEVVGKSRPTLTIKERDNRLWEVSLTDIHWRYVIGNQTVIIASGNLLTDNQSEILERFVILEVKFSAVKKADEPITNEDFRDVMACVHTRHIH